MWVEYANVHPWFEVLQTVHVPRSFLLDKRDVIYVDNMALFVILAAGSGLRVYRKDIPLYHIHDSVFGRRWDRICSARGI